MMPKDGFNRRSDAFRLIQRLSQLKQKSSALKWGDYQARYITDNVLVYERQFGHSVVLVAMNKARHPIVLQWLITSLPPGTYQDYLSNADFNRLLIVASTGLITQDLVLDGQSFAVWFYDEIPPTSPPMLGSVAPGQVRIGNTIALDGANFGTNPGQVHLGDKHMSIVSWTNTRIVARVSPGIRAGITNVTVRTLASISNAYSLRILSDIQIPVTFTFKNILLDNTYLEDVYLTGDVFELGEWSTHPHTAQGPIHSKYRTETNSTQWFYTVSLPGCWTVEFRYFRMNRRTKIVHWEQVNANHRYTVPCTGLGQINL